MNTKVNVTLNLHKLPAENEKVSEIESVINTKESSEVGQDVTADEENH